MKLSPDDPKLTAYALGELPENEAKEIEREIQNSPELRAAVEEIRQTAEILRNEFAAEPAPVLSQNEKKAITAKVQPNNVIELSQRSFWRTAGISAIAASVLFLIAWQLWSPKPQGEFSVAQNQQYAISSTPADSATFPEKLEQEMALLKPSLPLPVAPQETKAVAKSVHQAAADGKLHYSGRDEARSGYFVNDQIKEKLNVSKSETAQQPVETKAAPTLSEPSPVVVEAKSANIGKDDASVDGYSFKAPQSEFYARSELGEANRNNSLTSHNDYSKLAKTRNGNSVPYYSDKIVSPPPVQALPLTGRTMRTDDGHNITLYETPVRIAEAEAVRRQNVDGDSLQVEERRLGELRRDYLEQHPLVLNQKKKVETLRKRIPSGETARYPKYVENNFESVLQNPLSTFSIDVDTASYANVRRFLNENRMPPQDAVRIEEMINYFSYDYPQPKDNEPFSVNMEVASCPWQPEHRLLRIGLKGKEMAQNKRPPSNFVFLIDVSGSMSPQNRLPLVKQGLRMLVKRMTENDRIAIVVYASSSGVVLDSTSAVSKEKILEALDRLEAGGSTNGGQGIQRAYALAEENFIKGGVNRVILCTDGDFNVGITDQSELIKLIQNKAKSGVFLSVLGVGTDNYKDALMQKLADKGNGNYHYLDSVEEAHKVLVQQMNGTLVTIAKDVKIQIEFNPAQVSSYRLVGYEKRILAAEDFNNDKKDAGEIGAGHTVTALYEIVPAGVEIPEVRASVDELKYQKTKPAATPARRALNNENKEMLTLKLRYKKPDGDKSVLREHTLIDKEKQFSQASTDFRFAASVASFGMVLKDSEYKGRANFVSVLKLAKEAKGDDNEGYRAEFINLVKKAGELHRE